MTTGSVSRIGPTGRMTSVWFRALSPICLALGVAVCGLLVVYGSHVRAAVEAEKARAVEEEDQAFCARFGIGPETTRYSECAAALTDVRSRHDQRNADIF
jgi:hypothetical protein